MNKQELEELVNQAFASYNQTLYEADKKVILRAWYDVLSDLPYDGAKKALLRIVATEKFMPKPGDIRRTYIDTLPQTPKLLLPQSAWGILIGVIKNASSGLGIKEDLPEEVKKTIELLGDSVWTYHTNGDRTDFYKVYEHVVSEMQAQKYEIS